MLIIADTIEDIKQRHPRVVGFWGAPPRELLIDAGNRLKAPLVDLDVHYDAPGSGVLPKAYCHILKNCVDNALALSNHLACVVAAVGKEKCDGGRFAAALLRQRLDVEVVFAENHALPAPEPPALCEARGSVKDRAIRIMRATVEPLSEAEKNEALTARVAPTHGFWGTPPHPIGLLDLFPDTTHLFGWTRCVEQGRPADLELEMQVRDGLPTVFFSQGFCQKAALAKHLADTHNGLHVDVHDTLNAAIIAKIEAFIRIAGGAL